MLAFAGSQGEKEDAYTVRELSSGIKPPGIGAPSWRSFK